MPAKKMSLSPRESEVVCKLLAGEKQTAIAADLGISQRAVQIYLARAREKLQAKTLLHLVRVVIELRLFPKTKLPG
jgi:two-component system, LuxR family, response regulator FixJ